MTSRRAQKGFFGLNHITHRLHLGHHDVGQPVARFAGDQGHVVEKGRVLDRMHPHGNPCVVRSLQRQRHHHGSVFCFPPHGCTVFAVQCHVEDAGTKLFGHFCLQLQAFAHPRLDAAVMVTDR